MPTGVILNGHLFGPPNHPKLIVGMSLGHSVVFQVRRVPGDVPSSITLDHGDLLVMDGSTQLEYEHRMVSGLHCPRLTLLIVELHNMLRSVQLQWL